MDECTVNKIRDKFGEFLAKNGTSFEDYEKNKVVHGIFKNPMEFNPTASRLPGLVGAAFLWSGSEEGAGFWITVSLNWKNSTELEECIQLAKCKEVCVAFQADGKVYGHTNIITYQDQKEK